MGKEARYHIIGWTIYISYEISILAFSGATKGSLFNYLAYYIVYILLFYSFFLFLKRMEGTGYYVPKIIAGAIVILALFHLERGLVFNLLLPPGKHGKYWDYLLETSFSLYTARGVLFLILCFATWKGTFSYKKVRENAILKEGRFKLEKELAVAEIKYLKAQINPHFIHNTLNYLYYGLESKDKERADSLLLLSDILRYNITDIPPSGFVPLQGEVKNLLDLVKLAELRFEGNCHMQVKVQGNITGYVIIPMVLGTFIENLFKHGDISDPELPARIHIAVQENQLIFSTENKIKKAFFMDDRPNTGIEFARKRLSSYYPGRFSLTVAKYLTIFKLELKLSLL